MRDIYSVGAELVETSREFMARPRKSTQTRLHDLENELSAIVDMQLEIGEGGNGSPDDQAKTAAEALAKIVGDFCSAVGIPFGHDFEPATAPIELVEASFHLARLAGAASHVQRGVEAGIAHKEAAEDFDPSDRPTDADATNDDRGPKDEEWIGPVDELPDRYEMSNRRSIVQIKRGDDIDKPSNITTWSIVGSDGTWIEMEWDATTQTRRWRSLAASPSKFTVPVEFVFPVLDDGFVDQAIAENGPALRRAADLLGVPAKVFHGRALNSDVDAVEELAAGERKTHRPADHEHCRTCGTEIPPGVPDQTCNSCFAFFKDAGPAETDGGPTDADQGLADGTGSDAVVS